MCGIVGIIDLQGKKIDPVTLVKMNAAIRHRGIDDEGYVFINQTTAQSTSCCGADSPLDVKKDYPVPAEIDPGLIQNIGLGHRRFSIIDLTSGGHQPFFSRDRTCCIVFNGELYNYIELRNELKEIGCDFHTASDTEVFVEAYSKWGTDCFQKLNGFWAAAIYDFRRQHLILSRDRLGKKPLYWTRLGTRLYFASEIKALLQVQTCAQSMTVNKTAAYLWLKYGLRDLEGTTLFDGIHSFPAASWSVVDEAFPHKARHFWKLPQERMKEHEVGIDEACNSIRDILRDAVRIRMRSDVPWAIELSGGMDSSTLVALASELTPEKIQTFTVRFPDKEWNEEPLARVIAGRFNVDYHVLDPPLDNFWMQILPFTYLEEEPYHAPNLQTNQAIWTLMRAANAHVTLNGAAGDELFAGYASYYYNAQVENIYEGRLKNLVMNALYWSEKKSPGDGIVTTLNALKSLAADSRRLKQLISGVRRKPNPEFLKIDKVNNPITDRRLAQVLYSDMTNTKMPYWLRSGDKGYMGIPFEVRAPFLDYRLVEYVFQLPVTYLLRNGWHKWILRKSMEDLLPEDVLWRKRKMGFPFPFDRFYKESAPILDVIFNNAQNPFMDRQDMISNKNDWRLISFILWYELFFNKNMTLFHGISKLAKRNNRVMSHTYEPEFLKHFN